jgi:predicted metal-dependent peptidase
MTKFYRHYMSDEEAARIAVREPYLHFWICRSPVEESHDEDVRIGIKISNGKTKLVINPTWFRSLLPEERIAVLHHELMHPLLSVMKRGLSNTTHEVRNIAQDAWINENAKQLGFTLPDNHITAQSLNLTPTQVLNMATEELCAHVTQTCSKEKSKAPSNWDTHYELDEGEAEVVVRAMNHQYRQMGYQSHGSFGEIIEEVNSVLSKLSWKRILSSFTRGVVAKRRIPTMFRSNRRYPLPYTGSRPEIENRLLAIVDTSASMSDDVMQEIIAELRAIKKAGCKVSVVCCDTGITQRFELEDYKKIELKGGGGTDMAPAFEILEKETGFTGIVCFTDGYMSWPKQPKVPCLWVINTEVTPPWGKVARL